MPTTKTIPACLAPLTEYLQGLTRRASVPELRRAVPDQCFRDRILMSKWIDGNR